MFKSEIGYRKKYKPYYYEGEALRLDVTLPNFDK
jgi:hypothetical protein